MTGWIHDVLVRGPRALAAFLGAACVALASPAAAQPVPACLAGGADIVLRGTFTDDYYTRSMPAGTVVDAREATWIHCSQSDPRNPCEQNIYPVNLGPVGGSGACWAGGSVLGANRLDATWNEMHSPNNAGFIFENERFTVDGLRIHNTGDGIRPRGGAQDFVIKNAWLSYIRDDCVENDHLHAGLVEDSLFDGCFVGFSARRSTPTMWDGRNNVWTIRKSLVRLEPMPGPPEGGDLGHKGFFKWINWGDPDSPSPQVALFDNIFMAERSGQLDDERMGIPPGKLAACAGNVMVWLGEGPYPAALPSCFTVTTDRSVWDDAKAAWIRRHTQTCETDTDCDDDNPCTADRCDTGNGQCSNVPTNEGGSCGGGALCCAGECVAPACETNGDCDTGGACSTDTCTDGGTCAATCVTTPVADGTSCGTGAICCGGACGVPTCAIDADCDDGDICSDDRCIDGSTCQATCIATAVNEGASCGTDALCCAGSCTGVACSTDADCSDGDTCTEDVCRDAGTCTAACESLPAACGLADGCCKNGCDSSNDLDCPAFTCGNGVCEGGGENCHTCASDCQCRGKNCTKGCCGDGMCEGAEKAKNCPADCP